MSEAAQIPKAAAGGARAARVRARRHHPLRRARVALLWALRHDAASEHVARGAAAGMFVAMMPLWGVQTALAVFVAGLVRGNRLAAFALCWTSNPAFWYADYWVGRHVLARLGPAWGGGEALTFGGFVSTALRSIVVPVAVGCLVLGPIAAALAYAVTVPLARRYRMSRRARRRGLSVSAAGQSPARSRPRSPRG